MNRQHREPTDEQFVGAAVTAERLALCDLLDQLAPDEWHVQSLCDGWSVRDVVAHLTLVTRETKWDLFKGAVRARGSFDRMTADTSRATARRFTPAELVQRLRDTADSNRRAPMSHFVDPLIDVLVHGQDIARPLGRDRPMPTAAAAAAAQRAWDMRFPFRARKRLAGLRLAATDIDWTVGSGAPVEGPIAALLLLVTGRDAAVEQLTGDGVRALRRQEETRRPR